MSAARRPAVTHRIGHVEVRVDRAPSPGLLRPAIAARLSGLAVATGAEGAVADAVARAVGDARRSVR